MSGTSITNKQAYMQYNNYYLVYTEYITEVYRFLLILCVLIAYQ